MADSDPTRVEEEPREAPDQAVTQEVAAWVGRLVRTLKTCRLYDEANPTVVRFREDLASTLSTFLSGRDGLRLNVGSSTLLYSGQIVQVARSREDNLAGVLHRDGIRSLTLASGIEPAELDKFVDLMLQVTSPGGDDDLVTLLWDANLPHVILETVPVEGEADGGGEESAPDETAVAWPKQESRAGQPAAAEPEAAGAARSDDWATEERTVDLEHAFDELETMALSEIARFQQEHDAAADDDIVSHILGMLEDCKSCELNAEDRKALIGFAPRLLRESLGLGQWGNATQALRLLRGYDAEWSVDEFCANLCGPFALTTRKLVATVDRQDQKSVDAFLSLAREFGTPLAPWLMQVLADSQQMRVRRPLARTIAELLPGQPERIIPWLSDERWYVVRNAVHILGWIGGDDIASYLQAVADHPEPRVRREIVAALSQANHDASRPILMNMLKTADSQLFTTILHQLAMDDDEAIAFMFLELLSAESFSSRSSAEQRALYMALATRGDTVLPALEAELFESGGLFSRRPDSNRQAIALCIARIGTPQARAILERGVRSNRAPIRKACLIAGAPEQPA